VGALAVAVSFVFAFSAPKLAYAADLSNESFQAILLLLGVAAFAFAITHVVTEWASRRFGVVTGVEYVVLGAIVGPFAGLLSADILNQIAPALVLAQGSLGLLAGILLNFRNRAETSARTFGLGFVVTVGTGLAVAGIPFAALGYFMGTTAALQYLPQLLCAAAVASVASAAPLSSLIAFLDARGEGSDVVLRTARACSSFAVVIFGLIFCLFKPASELLIGFEAGALQSFAFWFGVHLAIGTTLGLIFTLFLIRDFEDEKILTVVIGMVIFTSGVAYYLKLSPIFVCFVLGLVLANICRQSDHVVRMLLSVERPLYIVLFLFFGASITLDVSWPIVTGVTVLYLALRGLGRFAGGLLANRLVPSMQRLPPVGSALLAPGALSAAMLLNFVEVFQGEAHVAELYAGLVLAVVVSEPLAYRFSRRWLIDATDVAVAREVPPLRGGDGA